MFDQMISTGLFAAVFALIELVKFVINKMNPKDDELEEDVAKIKEDLANITVMMKELYKMHMVKDQDGTPIWYVPRSWTDTQKEILSTVAEVSSTQKAIAVILERIDRKMEKSEKNGK